MSKTDSELAERADLMQRDVHVGKDRLRVYETGAQNSHTVLWLHGAGPGVGAVTNWKPLMSHLAQTFHNIAPDLLGFADSSHPDPAPMGMTAYTDARAKNLLALLDAEGLEDVDIVGNSMGGMIAISMALLAPGRLRRIVIHGSPGAPDGTKPRAAKVASFYDNPTLESVVDVIRGFFSDPDRFSDQIEIIAEERLDVALRPDVRRSHLATFDPTGGPLLFSSEQLGSIANEVLVIHGREDHLVPMEGSYYLAAQIPAAQFHVIPRSGHWVHVEQMKLFADVVSAFLTSPVRVQTA